jgi:ABC-type dipeptide/oligopeptide/nickel transport system permease component
VKAGFFKNVLRNSLIAMITVLGVNVDSLISGAVVIENVFNPRFRLAHGDFDYRQDYPVIVALTLVFVWQSSS